MNEHIAADERRRQPRQPVRAYARLSYSTREWETHLLDLSATGARLAVLGDHLLRPGDHVQLALDLSPWPDLAEQQSHLRLDATLVHLKEHILGLEHRPATEEDRSLLTQVLLAQSE